MKKIIFTILLLTGIITVVLWRLNMNPMLPIFIGLLAIILVITTWTQPTKHKNFSLSDQQKAARRSLGGSGTDAEPVEKIPDLFFKGFKKKK